MGLFEPFCMCLRSREAVDGLEPASEVVGGDDVAKMLTELVGGFDVVAFDGRFLDRPVRSFDLPASLGLKPA